MESEHQSIADVIKINFGSTAVTTTWTYLIAALLLFSCHAGQNQPVDPGVDAGFLDSEFVGSKACQSCHQLEYSDWEHSHHQKAMEIADSTNILGNFDHVTFLSNGVTSKFFTKDGGYFVHTQGRDGHYHDFKIKYTFGVDPLQQYIVEFPKGHFQCLQTAWDTNRKRWYDLQPDLDIKPDEWLHWTRGGMRWNAMCADCHSTDVFKNYDGQTDTYQTNFSEITVGCEACHGPASRHVQYYQSQDKNSSPPPKMYMDASLTSTDLVDKCARCHSRRSQTTKHFDYSGHFFDHYRPSLLIDPIYELDGQIRDEDYVYGSFVQSKMYQNGVSCRDCHNVHSLELKQSGNGLCLTCHEPIYNEPSHHFHPADSEGALCVNCHMTGKIYMGVDFRRDHSFRIPRPDQTVTHGTPNACNGCHTDKSAEWASDHVKSNYGQERADHFSDHLLSAYQGNKSEFYHVITHGTYPDLVRATALDQYTNEPLSPAEVNALTAFLEDTSDLVRSEAINAFTKLRWTQISKYIEPLLADSTRLVRISAARYFNELGSIPSDQLHFDNAQKEFLEDLDMNSDFASGQHQIALYHQSQQHTDLAIEAYTKALAIDNYYNSSRMNLALLLYEQGQVSEAEELYLKVTEQEPDFSHAYHMLGLLYNESGDAEKALKYLADACEREPVNIRAFYNYALKLQEVGQLKQAVKIIDKGLALSPANEELLYVKVLAQFNDRQFDAARSTCQQLLDIAPNNANYRQILDQLTPRM